MPPENNPLINATQLPAAPQEQLNLPAILSAISSLGLNIAGAATSHGDVGDGALSLSQQLQARSDQERKAKFEDETKAAKQKQIQNRGGATAARAPEIFNPAARRQMQTSANNGDPEEANKILQEELSRQNQRGREQKTADSDLSKGLGDFIGQKHELVKQAQKDLPPAATQALAEQAFFQSAPKPFDGPEALKESWNQRKDAKKINETEAVQLYNKYTSFVNDQRAPVLGNDFLGKTLGFGKPAPNKEAFASYAEKTLTPDDLKAAKAQTAEIQSHLQDVNNAHQMRQMLLNPKTRPAARQKIEEFLGTGGRPAASANQDGKVEVINPKGEHGFIPASQVKQAISQGYTVK